MIKENLNQKLIQKEDKNTLFDSNLENSTQTFLKNRGNELTKKLSSLDQL